MFIEVCLPITGIGLVLLSVAKLYSRRQGAAFLLTPEGQFWGLYIGLALLTFSAIWAEDSPLRYLLIFFDIHMHKRAFWELTFLAALVYWVKLTKRRIHELDTDIFCEVLGADRKKRQHHFADHCALYINNLVTKMIGRWTVRYLIRCCWYRVVRKEMPEKKRVQRLLARARAENVLNDVIVRMNVPKVIEFASSPPLRALLMSRELTQGQGGYSLEARVALLTALQQVGRLRTDDEMQEWAIDLIRGIDGDQLVELKNCCNAFGRFYSFYKLVTHEITHPEKHKALLEHLSSHCRPARVPSHDASLEAAMLRRSGYGSGPLKVLSDIDDTLFCSGGFPAGVDRSFPKGVVYPGMCRLLRQLDGPKESIFCNIVFLSARPHFWKNLSESMTYDIFNLLTNHGRFHGMPNLIPGSFVASVHSVFKRLLCCTMPWDRMGEEKFKSIMTFSQLHPESDIVFFGDNGQGDVVAAEMAQQHKVPLLYAAFIHIVQPLEKTTTRLRECDLRKREEKWRELGIFFVRSPLAAAGKAASLGLIDKNGLESVCEAAKDDLIDLQILYDVSLRGYKKHVENHNNDVEALISDPELQGKVVNLSVYKVDEGACIETPVAAYH